MRERERREREGGRDRASESVRERDLFEAEKERALSESNWSREAQKNLESLESAGKFHRSFHVCRLVHMHSLNHFVIILVLLLLPINNDYFASIHTIFVSSQV